MTEGEQARRHRVAFVATVATVVVLDQVAKAGPRVADADLQPLKQRLASLGSRLA